MRERMGLGIAVALGCSTLLVVTLMYVAAALSVGEWKPWTASSTAVQWDEVAKISLPAAALIAAVVGAVIAAYGHQTRLEELALSRDSDVTDRYTRAVEQLGNDQQLAVRLGGIYALERIHHDSERDRAPIKNLLKTFVSTNADRRQGPGDDPVIPDLAPSADVAAALQTLGRLNTSGVLLNVASLVGIDLSDAQLPSCQLVNAALNRAVLRGAVLKRARLGGAILVEANLTSANLFEVDLFEADLTDAALVDADLRGADLVRAILTRANLRGANLRDANLRDANLGNADLTRAHLTRAELKDANLADANFRDVDLVDANLRGADLRGADLTRADLTRADLRTADLRGADLTDADFRDADLTDAALDGVRWAADRAPRGYGVTGPSPSA